MKKKKEIVLSIAGSDPSGGAGVQADLKSFSFLGLHGVTVVTCVTAQNTQRVHKIYKLPVELIEQQLDVLYEDMHPDAVKTGMLYDHEIVQCVSRKISRYTIKPVVDPVMVATSGDALSDNTFVHAMKKDLLPKAYVLTANIPEACALLGTTITSLDEMKQACKGLHEMGPHYVLVKGGHLDTEDASDFLFDGRTVTVFSLPRIPAKTVHGSGCTLSALITGYLAQGERPGEAVRKARETVKSHRANIGSLCYKFVILQ